MDPNLESNCIDPLSVVKKKNKKNNRNNENNENEKRCFNGFDDNNSKNDKYDFEDGDVRRIELLEGVTDELRYVMSEPISSFFCIM